MDLRSHVEIHFPHIAKGLVEHWKDPFSRGAFLDQLTTDDRGGRIGFLPAVFDELMFLSDLLWQIEHPEADHVDIYMDAFRFGINPSQKPKA